MPTCNRRTVVGQAVPDSLRQDLDRKTLLILDGGPAVPARLPAPASQARQLEVVHCRPALPPSAVAHGRAVRDRLLPPPARVPQAVRGVSRRVVAVRWAAAPRLTCRSDHA